MYSVAVLTALKSLLGEGRGVEGQQESYIAPRKRIVL